jgi:protein TonB
VAAGIEPPPFVEQTEPGIALGDESAPVSEPVAAAAPIARPSMPPPPTPAEPAAVSPGEARYLRVYETFPSLPRSLWVSGRLYAVIAQVCVTVEGRVSDVTIKRGAAPELDHAVTATMRSWRYRPRIVQGRPRPFCHLMKLEFSLRQ